MKNVIFDFIGIIADVNYVKLALDLPITQKVSAFRIFLSMKKNPALKSAFNCYQKGLIDSYQLYMEAKKVCPNSAYVVPELLKRLPNYIKVNENVISMATKLRKNGIRTFIMSNAIPETEAVMKKYDLSSAFEQVFLSNQLGMKKPEEEMFAHALENCNLNPEETILIDDTKKNLVSAQRVGIRPICCKNTTQVCDTIKKLFKPLFPKQDCITERTK